MEAADANKINFIEDRHYESDFIFTNYYYFTRPIYNKKRYIILIILNPIISLR